MNTCIVCEAILPPGRTRTCTQSCAKVLADRTKQENIFGPRDRLREKYGNAEKQGAREVMEPDLLALRWGARVLDLYGGGLSAEWIKSVRPDVELWVAERDPKLWPALRADGKRVGFTQVLGGFSWAAGTFDFIFLDLCAEPPGAYEATCLAVPMLAPKPSALYVTILRQNRHGYPELHKEMRDIAVQAALDRAAVLREPSVCVRSYRQAGGRGIAELWRVGASYVDQARVIARQTFQEAARAEDRLWATDRNLAWHRTWHRESAADWYRDRNSPVSHAATRCRCLSNGWITLEERDGDRARYRDFRGEGQIPCRRYIIGGDGRMTTAPTNTVHTETGGMT